MVVPSPIGPVFPAQIDLTADLVLTPQGPYADQLVLVLGRLTGPDDGNSVTCVFPDGPEVVVPWDEIDGIGQPHYGWLQRQATRTVELEGAMLTFEAVTTEMYDDWGYAY